MKQAVCFFTLSFSFWLSAQHIATEKDIEEVVVSGNTFEQKAKEVPIPIKVIDKKQIAQSGSMRLSDILAEQTGLVLIENHGVGVQMQGMSSEYTLILLNGEPLMGRTAGTLDLSRISVNNIKRIEIIKGSSSSLYGSDALAGVINIITEDPNSNSGELKVRYGTNTTIDVGGYANWVKNKFSANVSADRYSSEGYALGDDLYNKTVSPFENYTYSARLRYKPNTHWDFSIYSRLYTENLYNQTIYEDQKVNGKTISKDFNLSPQIAWTPNDKLTSSLRFYMTSYKNDSHLKFLDTQEVFDDTFYKERYYKVENFTEYKWKPNLKFTLGAGGIYQEIEANRYNDKKTAHQFYGLAQVAYNPYSIWKILAGVRYDYNSIYGDQFNPKLATEVAVTPYLDIHASVGRGFKAPDFRQLYLNFSNSLVGYSVLGTQELEVELQKLIDQGQIDAVLINPSTIKNLKAESSWAYNAGLTLKPVKGFNVKLNAFRNDIENLIQTVVVARKVNGQSLYSYQNFDRVFTQGIEAEASLKFLRNFRLSAGYQYLEAKEKDKVNEIKAGQIYGYDDRGEVIKIKAKDYFGLPNRSKHTFNAKIFYENIKGWNFNIRGIYRGEYGFADMDGNGIINNKSEMAPGYFTMNAAIGKKFSGRYQLTIGAANLFDYKKPAYTPEFYGRLLWASFKITY
ncbi:TonB-dependent siderophore receptor [Elizabethkingia sp. JS20170427COW]|uniref:TonB-dependent receptor plug domain-containing protein n=1 Tax=Elizabethkingia sp. JS20170427COW TaxID=2583851 RepID=UPI001110597C|nr:TonB-dependent receptor [Elizabethkingia sp. JS20170427COW]QCX53081.1 TonB-dependent receptor [Elizabethkingia sp. JS20170427COW]